MEQHRRMTKRELINMIEEEYGEDTKFDVHTINFDAGQKISDIDKVSKKRICLIANESKSIIFSGNQYLSHVDIHSVFQPNIYDIKPMGCLLYTSIKSKFQAVERTISNDGSFLFTTDNKRDNIYLMGA